MAATPTPPVRPLPRGRHGLTREEVRASQRGRMLVAMAEAVAERGYTSTSVADVLKRAGVSRETFYEHFADKQACFLAAHDQGVETLFGKLSTALADASGEVATLTRIDGVLQRYLETLAANPAIARTFLVEVYAAGPEALAKRAHFQARFVDAFAALIGATDDRERFACRMFVAAVSSLVTTEVSLGRFDRLADLREPLLDAAVRLLETREERGAAKR